MTSSGPTALIIDDGRPPALAAAVIQADPSRALFWHIEGHDAAAECRRRCVEQHADLLGAAEPVCLPAWRADTDRRYEGPGLHDALELLQAAIVARAHGCARIVWPIQVGPDPEQVGAIVEIASSVAEIIDLEANGAVGSISIDIPVMDLDDRQIVDLADDAGAPWRSAWPCEQAGSTPCGACSGCHRWRSAFEAALVPWPWSSALVR